MYHCEWSHQFRNNNLPLAGRAAPDPVGPILWKLKIPGKIKKFYWRALHGILSLKSILTNRHVGTNGNFPICLQGPEDVLHLLFGCTTIAEMCRQMGVSQLIDEAMIEDRSGYVGLEHILQMPDSLMPNMTTVGLKEGIAATS